MQRFKTYCTSVLILIIKTHYKVIINGHITNSRPKQIQGCLGIILNFVAKLNSYPDSIYVDFIFNTNSEMFTFIAHQNIPINAIVIAILLKIVNN